MAIKKKSIEDDPYRTNMDKTREKMKEVGGDGKYWKPKPNSKNIVRILPPWGKSANGVFYFAAGFHYNFEIGGRSKAIACNRVKDKNERCLVCEFIEALRNSGGEDQEKLVMGSKGIKLKKKYFVNLVDRKEPDKVFIYGAAKKMIQAIQEAMEDPDFGDITDVDEGFDMRINRQGAGFTDTRYTFSVRPKSCPLGMDDWKDKIHKLDEVVVEWVPLAEQAKAIRSNYGEEMAEVGFKINLPGEKLKKKKVEDEDEEDQDDEEEEEVKPKKKVKKKDEEDEDEDEDEDEEDDEIKESGDDDDDEDDDEEDED